MQTDPITTSPPKSATRRGKREDALASALRQLEHSALSPVDPGELLPWLQGLGEALEAVARAWSIRQQRHRDIQREIASADAALYHRVSTLSKRAQRQHRELVELGAGVESLRRALKDDAPVAVKREQAWELRDRVVYWSVALRVLDNELDTWFAEAFYRDRGVAH